MRQILFYGMLLLFIVISASCLAQERENRQIVVIDPGHGGTDSGAVGINGVREKDVVLDIAKEILRLNRELYKDTLAVYLTRYSDTLIPLRHRTTLAKILRAVVFVSIHCNHAEREEAQGIEVYTKGGNTQSERLAYRLTKRMSERLGFKNRGVNQANFQVLRETKGFCPSVLLELGFLSNQEEARHNAQQSSHTAFALSILQTLKEFSYDSLIR